MPTSAHVLTRGNRSSTPLIAELPVDAALNAEGVQRTFRSVSALKGITLSIRPGETVSIVGPSGSGKSTLLHCLSGLDQPSAGRVCLGTLDLGNAPQQTLAALRRTTFGFVFQADLLLNDLTLAENVALPLMFSGMNRRDAIGRAEQELTTLGIATLRARLPGEVSGGEAQRAAVARAMVSRPRFVFADEPTGSLDSKNADVVVEQLLGVSADRGAAVIIVTHDPALARRCGRVLRLLDGVVVSDAL